jgi:GNAT superfamily N-acetyltransferase
VLDVTAVRAEDTHGLESFRALLAEYEESLPADLRIPNVETELQILPERYAEGALLLARDGEAAIGCVVVNRLEPASAEIKRLYVVPAARRTGAGRALMEAAIAFARESSYRRIVLDTERNRLESAYKLYRSLGFVRCEPYAPAEYADPTYMELVL